MIRRAVAAACRRLLDRGSAWRSPGTPQRTKVGRGRNVQPILAIFDCGFFQFWRFAAKAA
ncbi:MAG: hypothetical protein LCI02_05705 [Proteobacteria bacterium]|nr:hypothetical protein [Pseudomonadota bacterium]